MSFNLSKMKENILNSKNEPNGYLKMLNLFHFDNKMRNGDIEAGT